jgi:transposase
MEEEHKSAARAAATIGACRRDAQNWMMLYENHGAEGLIMKKGSYSGEFKVSVVEYMHANGLNIQETSSKFGIPSPTTVGNWKRIYYEEGREALYRNNRGRKRMADENRTKKPKMEKRVEEDLIAENQRLRMEVAYLKKLNALVQERVQRENGKKQQPLTS